MSETEKKPRTTLRRIDPTRALNRELEVLGKKRDALSEERRRIRAASTKLTDKMRENEADDALLEAAVERIREALALLQGTPQPEVAVEGEASE